MALLSDTSQGSAITRTTADKYIPELWTDELLKAREKKLVMVNKIMAVRPQGLRFGDTVHIPRLSNETALDKTAESAVTFSAATETEITVNITKYKYVAKLVEDIVEVQSKYDLFSNYRDKIAYALADVVDSDILALTQGITQSVGQLGAAGLSVNEAMILAGIRMLDAANVPQEDRYLVVDAYGREDLLSIANFIRYDAGGKSAASTAVNSGVIGEAYGLKVLFSNNIYATATSAFGMIFHKEAFAIALQKDVSIKTEYSVDYIGTKMVGYEIYGLTIARTDHAVLLRYVQS